MIPKIIHYCWFGGKDKPEEFYRFKETWQRFMPDYHIKEWNESNFDINYCEFTREAYASRNYAHVSDVCRLYALYTEGGIYFDTDIEVCQTLNPYLHLNSFLGVEHEYLGTGVIGAEPGAKWLDIFLNYYRTRHFINLWGHTVRTPNTKILTEDIMPVIPDKDKPTIYAKDYFCGKIWQTGEIVKTENTATIHHYAASWRRHKTLKQKISAIIEGLSIRYLHKAGRSSSEHAC